MRKFFSIFLLLALPLVAPAQSTRPYSNVVESYSQLWNLAATYRGVSGSTLGSQLDSLFSGSLYLSTASFGSGSFALAPLPNGTGSLSVWSSVLKASTTTTVTATATLTPEGSPDGTHWATLPGITVATLTTTSRTVPATTLFVFPVASTTTGGKCSKYLRIKVTNTADSLSVYAGYLFYAN